MTRRRERGRPPRAMTRHTPAWSIGPLLIWAVVILLLMLAAVMVRSAEAAEPPSLSFDSPATVSVVGPGGGAHCVRVPVRWTLTEEGIEAHMVVPGPIAGRPWTCHSSRTWESLAAEFEGRRDEFADLLLGLGAKRLAAWIEQARARP